MKREGFDVWLPTFACPCQGGDGIDCESGT